MLSLKVNTGSYIDTRLIIYDDFYIYSIINQTQKQSKICIYSAKIYKVFLWLCIKDFPPTLNFCCCCDFRPRANISESYDNPFQEKSIKLRKKNKISYAKTVAATSKGTTHTWLGPFILKTLVIMLM